MASTSIPAQMKAQVLKAYNTPYVYTTLPVPTLSSDDDLLIKVDAAGYCHTDAVLASGQMKPEPHHFPHRQRKHTPWVPESASLVDDFMFVVPVSSAKTPNNDTVGYSNFCPYGLSNGLSKDGGFSEYALVDARQVAILPDSMTAVDAAPLMCAGVTIYNALKRCRLSPGQRVAIIGAGGGLGHLGLQFAEAMGLRTIGVDAADGPLKLTRSLGMNGMIVDARSHHVQDLVEQIGVEDQIPDQANVRVDAVIILVGNQAGFDYGVKLLRNHGLCVVVSFATEFQVSARDLVYRDISVVGTVLGTRSSLQEMVVFAEKHNIKAIKKTYTLEDLNSLVDEYHKGKGGKLVVDMPLE